MWYSRRLREPLESAQMQVSFREAFDGRQAGLSLMLRIYLLTRVVQHKRSRWSPEVARQRLQYFIDGLCSLLDTIARCQIRSRRLQDPNALPVYENQSSGIQIFLFDLGARLVDIESRRMNGRRTQRLAIRMYPADAQTCL